jgi:N-acetylglucosaminyldiphosphoundecaprenol N-acetyl-beta-D-mannosaminyltransferase
VQTVDRAELPPLIVAPRVPECVTADDPVTRHHLFHVNLDIFDSVSQAADKILGGARRRGGGTAVFTCNVDHLMIMKSNEVFRAAYQRAEVATIDGAPLALLSRCTGTKAARRVTGVDLADAMFRLAEERALRVALVGGEAGRAVEAAQRLEAAHPNLPDVFTASPAMGFEIGDADDELLLKGLEEFRPDIVIVCLGAPRQELWIDAHKARFPGTVLIGAGATIDFLAGSQSRAPKFCQKSGTEAVWRLSTDFRRLWRRYLVRDIGFLAQFPVVVGSYTVAKFGVTTSVRSHPHNVPVAHGAGRCSACVSDEHPLAS